MAMEPHERDMLDRTHSMVKEMYTMLVGTEDYREGSVLHQLNILKEQVRILSEDKIRRDATVKTVAFLASGFGSLVGGLAVMFYNIFIKNK